MKYVKRPVVIEAGKAPVKAMNLVTARRCVQAIAIYLREKDGSPRAGADLLEAVRVIEAHARKIKKQVSCNLHSWKARAEATATRLRAELDGDPTRTEASTLHATETLLVSEKKKRTAAESALKASQQEYRNLREHYESVLAQGEASEAALATCRKALVNLVQQLDACHNDPRFEAVWVSYMIHDGRYNGPYYTKELDAARTLAALGTTRA